MKNVVDIITRLQMTAEDGSKSDRRLAAWCCGDLDFASQASISDIAARIDVSEPLSRASAAGLGCEGVRDFKFWLAQAIAVGGHVSHRRTAQPRPARTARGMVVTEAAIAAISVSAPASICGRFSRGANCSAGSGQVLSSARAAPPPCWRPKCRTGSFGSAYRRSAQVDGQLQRMFAAVATPQTTVLAFSISGYAQSVVDAVQVARQYGGRTVAITAPSSALAASPRW